MRKLAVALFMTGALAVAGVAHATPIVDTGPGPNSGGWVLGPLAFIEDSQWLAGEFSTTQTWEVTSVEGWIDPTVTGDVRFALYTDGGDIPGTLLFSQTISIAGGGPAAWYGPSGLSWLLTGPSTYWVAFETDPTSSFRGGMLAPSSAPLINEAVRLFPRESTWFGSDDIGIGVRISANAVDGTAVPEPTSLVLLGTGLIGVGIRRYRRRP